MPQEDIIRAWKDQDYRDSLSEEQRAQLPESPVGVIEDLTDEEMGAIGGGSFGCISVAYTACPIVLQQPPSEPKPKCEPPLKPQQADFSMSIAASLFEVVESDLFLSLTP